MALPRACAVPHMSQAQEQVLQLQRQGEEAGGGAVALRTEEEEEDEEAEEVADARRTCGHVGDGCR